ncbi:LamG-like jellyroll fold domain-containing protein [Tropicimonas sediminicola]|uniref:Concanavalin A-like lectin/glucanases superfamily protein n=1 Tax=Tropicimonas sediminicola TaxID=1031541 RepID=A0A239GZV0_9RHOB|nr:LamG-like jellyroll fold domain-containing protein [Tropicimonas sediminicola]SNS74395.1 Concanavalin A-like lectin/glucanases superfamily protein [Tropicimonas sediminicola]
MTLIRLVPVTEIPHVPHASVKTGNAALDNSWMSGSRLNSKLLPSTSKCILKSESMMLFLRGGIDGKEYDQGLNIFDAPIVDFEGWKATGWTVRSPDVPLFQPDQMPARFSHVDGFMSGHVPVCMSSGRIILSYKFKERNGPSDVVLEGDGATTVFEAPYPVGFAQSVSLSLIRRGKAAEGKGRKKGRGEKLARNQDYALRNVGTDAPLQIEYPLNGKPLPRGARLSLTYNLKAFRHYVYSDDGGNTWTYGGHYTDENGRPGRFGQSAILERAPGDWVMADNTGEDNIISVRFSKDGVAWGAPIKIYEPTVGDDWFDQGHIIGLVFFEDPQDPDWVYLIYTGGNGFDGPDTPQFDYPEAAGLLRSRRDDMTNWELYPHNPIHTRGSISGACSGGIWMPSVARITDYLFSSGETVGALPVPLRPEQLDGIRDIQYGQLEDRVVIPHLPAYAARTLSFAVQFTAEELKGDVLAKSRNNETDGDFRLSIERNGVIQVIHSVKGRKRRVSSKPRSVQEGERHEAIVTFAPEGVTLWLDGQNVGTSRGNGDVTANSSPFILGQGIRNRFDMRGTIHRFAVFDRAIGPADLDVTGPEDAGVIGWWDFDAAAPTADDTSRANTAELQGNATVTENGVRFIGPTYGSTIASQQLPCTYRGPLWSEIWDATPFPDGLYTLQSVSLPDAWVGLSSAAPDAALALVQAPSRWRLTWKEGHLTLATPDRVVTSLDRHSDAPPALAAPIDGNVTRVQQFHLITSPDGVRLRNRDSGNMLSVAEGKLGLRAYLGDESELFMLVPAG